MYVCLFFNEDRSLSVLPRNDKNLTYEEFSEGEKCTMKWLGRKVYCGTILKINDDPEFLEKWASKANSVILKKAKAMGTEELIEKLLGFSFCDKVSGNSKRQRTETSRAKESKEQEQDLSPKKRKGKDNCPQKTKTQKHSLTSTESSVEPTKEKEKQNTEATEADHTGEVKSPNKPSKEKEKKNAEATAALNSSMEIFSMASQFTPMSETWNLCTAVQETSTGNFHIDPPTNDFYRPQTDHVADPQLYDDSPRDYSDVVDPIYATLEPHKYTTSSEPSAKVVGILQGILDPDFQNYVRKLLRQCGKNYSQQNSYDHDGINSIRPPDCTRYEDVNRDVEDSVLPLFDASTPTASPKRITYDHADRQTPRRSPRIAGKSNTPQSSLRMAPILLSPSEQHQIRRVLLPCTKEKASEELPQATRITNATDSVKLMEKSSITVDRAGLKKAISLAKKSANPGYALCRKVLPLLFTIDEMARSRGQDLLKAKEGDLRPALNAEKIQILKDYILSWCKTNGFSVPSEAKINEGVTERIAYSRRLLKNLPKE